MCKPCETIDNGPCKGYCAALNSCGKESMYQPFSNGMNRRGGKKEGNIVRFYKCVAGVNYFFLFISIVLILKLSKYF